MEMKDFCCITVDQMLINILMFATDNYLLFLAKSDTRFVDGNFRLVPKLFKQLYVIRVQLCITHKFRICHFSILYCAEIVNLYIMNKYLMLY